MGNVKGYVEYKGNRTDFDDSDAVAFVVINGENAMAGIYGKLTGIMQHIDTLCCIDKVKYDITECLEKSLCDELKKIIETEETQ